MDLKSMTGSLQCGVCDAKFQTNINSLSEQIDVFTEWLDEASEIQAQTTKSGVGGAATTNARQYDEEEEDENELLEMENPRYK